MRILRRGGYPSGGPPLKSLSIRRWKPVPARPNRATMTVMSGVAVQAGVDPAVRRERVVRIALAVLLLAGWVTWAAQTYVSQLRVVRVDRFHEDLAAGHVVAFRAVSNVRHDGSWPPDGSPDLVDLPATNEDGTVEWQDGMTMGPPPTVAYWTDARVGAVRVVDANAPGSSSADVLIQELRQAGVPVAGIDEAFPGDQADPWGLLAGLLALIVVVRGPVPTRGNRWFWFWLLGVTWGLGVVAYAVLELLRPRPGLGVARGAVTVERVAQDGPPTTHELGHGSGERFGGWRGLLLSIVLGILLSVAGSEISRAAGGIWVPLP